MDRLRIVDWNFNGNRARTDDRAVKIDLFLEFKHGVEVIEHKVVFPVSNRRLGYSRRGAATPLSSSMGHRAQQPPGGLYAYNYATAQPQRVRNLIQMGPPAGRSRLA